MNVLNIRLFYWKRKKQFDWFLNPRGMTEREGKSIKMSSLINFFLTFYSGSFFK